MPSVTCKGFLESKEPTLVSRVKWGRSGLSFEIASYLSNELPPKALVTSVRGIVSYLDGYVVLENPDGYTFMPGGRLEPNESYEEALRREIWEECGLDVSSYVLLGFLHFKHLQSKPDGYAYPYPDQFQIVYAVEGTGKIRSGDTEGYEMSSHIYSSSEAIALKNTEPGHPFMKRVAGI